MPKESLEVSRLIDATVSETLAAGKPGSFLEFTKAVLVKLQYDLPAALDRAIGVPTQSPASIHAHCAMQTGRA